MNCGETLPEEYKTENVEPSTTELVTRAIFGLDICVRYPEEV